MFVIPAQLGGYVNTSVIPAQAGIQKADSPGFPFTWEWRYSIVLWIPVCTGMTSYSSYSSLIQMYSSFLYKQESVIPAKLVPVKLVPVKLVLAKAG